MYTEYTCSTHLCQCTLSSLFILLFTTWNCSNLCDYDLLDLFGILHSNMTSFIGYIYEQCHDKILDIFYFTHAYNLVVEQNMGIIPLVISYIYTGPLCIQTLKCFLCIFTYSFFSNLFFLSTLTFVNCHFPVTRVSKKRWQFEKFNVNKWLTLVFFLLKWICKKKQSEHLNVYMHHGPV